MGTIVAESAGVEGAGVARDLCRRLIGADRGVTLKQAQVAGAWLGVKVEAAVYEAVQREFYGSDAGVLRSVVDDQVIPEEPEGSPGSGKGELTADKPRAASMAFIVEFLRSHPAATYREVKVAAEAEGLRVVPIVYGNAKRLAGLPKRTGTPRQSPTRRGRGSDHREPTPRARPARRQAGPRHPAPRQEDPSLGDLAEMVRRFQDALADLRETLARIHDVARGCLEQTR